MRSQAHYSPPNIVLLIDSSLVAHTHKFVLSYPTPLQPKQRMHQIFYPIWQYFSFLDTLYHFCYWILWILSLFCFLTVSLTVRESVDGYQKIIGLKDTVWMWKILLMEFILVKDLSLSVMRCYCFPFLSTSIYIPNRSDHNRDATQFHLQTWQSCP